MVNAFLSRYTETLDTVLDHIRSNQLRAISASVRYRYKIQDLKHQYGDTERLMRQMRRPQRGDFTSLWKEWMQYKISAKMI